MCACVCVFGLGAAHVLHLGILDNGCTLTLFSYLFFLTRIYCRQLKRGCFYKLQGKLMNRSIPGEGTSKLHFRQVKSQKKSAAIAHPFCVCLRAMRREGLRRWSEVERWKPSRNLCLWVCFAKSSHTSVVTAFLSTDGDNRK